MLRLEGGLWRWCGPADFGAIQRGHAPGGPQDRWSAVSLNRLLGNADQAGLIECTLLAPVITVTRACHIAIGGALVQVHIDGQAVEAWQVHAVEPGQRIRMAIGRQGCRVYCAVAGGLTDELSPAGDPLSAEPGRQRGPLADGWAPPPGILRVLPGPEFAPQLAERLGQPWLVSSESDGMGLRLQGAALPLARFDIRSAPVCDGTVQATAAGLLALLRQRGCLGGYPRVAQVLDCDVDRLAQLRPGQVVHLHLVDEADAEAAQRAYERLFSDPTQLPSMAPASRP